MTGSTLLRKLARSAPLLAVVAAVAAPVPAQADKFRNPSAIFAGLDKITGRIISFEVAVNETVQFGALQLTPKVCYTRPANETPQTSSFVEVDEIALNNEYRRIFSGWMFAASPGLNALEHPVYDLWLTDCKGATERDRIVTAPEPVEVALPEPAQNRPVRNANDPPLRDDRRQQARQARPAGPIIPGQPLDPVPLAAPPRPQPSQRFFPTNNAPLILLPGGEGSR
jgi:hypothetical protein